MRLDVRLPACTAHPDTMAVAFCNACGRPICGRCLSVVPVAVQCPACRPIGAQRLPSRTAWLVGFLGGLWRRPWAVTFAAGLLLFLAVIALMPGLLRPVPPAAPQAIRKTTLRAPYLEKTFRLASLGDLLAARGAGSAARSYYKKALAACSAHLATEKNMYLRLQVRLGVGRLQAKSGQTQVATETFRAIIREARDRPATGVAHFYLGQLLEETAPDTEVELPHYRAALEHAQREGRAARGLDTIVSFVADEGEGGKSVYAVAALTDTLVRASGAMAEIAKRIEAITGEPVPAHPVGRVPMPRAQPQELEEPGADPLRIVPGE